MSINNYSKNFEFLADEYPLLANLSQSAEYHLYTDPAVSLFKLRLFGEKLTEILFQVHFLDLPYKDSLHYRILDLQNENILPDRIASLLIIIKNKGNIAVHQNRGNFNDGMTALLSAFTISKWFVDSYADSPSSDLNNLRFEKPPQLDARHALSILEQVYSELEGELETYKSELKKLTEDQEAALKVKAFKAANKIELTEAETRAIIDEQLRQAGWEADTDNLRFSKGTRPQKGKNLAIAEWNLQGKKADYALFIGLNFYGVVEAKKRQKDVISDLGQAKVYAKRVAEEHGAKLLGQWGNYHVPFLFSTNSRPYHKELETKSGTWFLDGRKSTNHPRALRGWFSPRDLKELYKQNIPEANSKLQEEPFDYLQDKEGLSLRYYQVDAIKAVEEKVINNFDEKRALLAMATGTGKTRTIIGLCYRLIKSKRFKRILFLVDRNILGKQAADSFNDVVIDDFQTFDKIYDLKGMKDKLPDPDTKVHFATVQSLVKRILYTEENQSAPAIGNYDCIIVDEAHRGYTLDKEMDEDEVDFKNQKDFVSKYKLVLDYFDAFRIGLTATPALHTSQIFGKPVYRYTYPQAVIDGFLIDHEPPFNIKTKLSQLGIVWKKGEKPKVYDRNNNIIIELDELEDEMKIDIEGFNKLVITENFNKAVIKELVKYLDPEDEEKTLIFAASDEHADLVVKLLKAAFKKAEIDVDDDAIKKITGSVYDPPQQVINYKNEKYPNIVVTVDLLTTGVDVPEICNLVFLRRVKSRILYDQMLGRATRKCDKIGKEVFKIYDAVRLYESLQDVSEMRPVVVNPTATFEQLINEIDSIEKEQTIIKQIEQLVAKIQRKRKTIQEKNENEENFLRLSGGESPDEFIKKLRELEPKEAAKLVKKKKELFKYLDEMRGVPKHQLISHHEDEVQEVARGYGEGTKPEDYLQNFKTFIEENRNKIAAIDIICTRPKELTRKSLKELLLILSGNGFTTPHLKTAWKQSKNEDIAADIIAYIRTLTMGTALETREERIERAFKQLFALRKWTKIQRNWLERIRSKLIDEIILDEEFFSKEPFKSDGGYKRLNKIFKNELDLVVNTINDNLYSEIA